jgi:Flp pilus assembly protein protease CpaA
MIVINYVFAFFGLLIASYTDIKTREVPDWLNFSLMGLGFGVSAIYSLMFNSFNYLLSSIIGFAVAFVLGYLMYYTGQWGGGDSKMLMALGALIGIDIHAGFPVIITLLINIMIVGAFYGLFWSMALAIINRKKVKVRLKEKMVSKNILIMRRIIIAICIIGIISFFFVPLLFKIPVLILVGSIFFIFYLWLMIKIVEEVAMEKYVPLTDLTEGDWVLEEVFVGKEKICSKKDLGLSNEQIAKLIKLKSKHKKSKIKIKVGIPFLPSFLIGFIALLIAGNWIGLLF